MAVIRKVRVRLRSRSVIEPGCIVVAPGHVMDIPAEHYDPANHELVNPPAAAHVPAADPPVEAEPVQSPAVSQEDEDDIRLFEEPTGG